MKSVLKILGILFLFVSIANADLRKIISPNQYTGNAFEPIGFMAEYESYRDENKSDFFDILRTNELLKYILINERRIDVLELKVIGKWHIDGLSCIKIYSIRKPLSHHNIYPSINLLINECDSTVYFFGEKLDKYNKLIEQELNTELNNEEIINIVDLYLNSISSISPYFILNSVAEVQSIYDTEWVKGLFTDESDTTGFYEKVENNRKKAIEKARKSVKPPVITEYNGDYNIQLYSFSLNPDLIEYWAFKINKHGMEMLERTTIIDFRIENLLEY